MKCICPECKNEIEMKVYPNVAVGHVIECNTCGIMLEIRSLAGAVDGNIETEIVDEGK